MMKERKTKEQQRKSRSQSKRKYYKRYTKSQSFKEPSPLFDETFTKQDFKEITNEFKRKHPELF